MLARREEFEMADESPRLESRVARIESDVAHINSSVANIHLDLRELRREMGDGLKTVNGRIDALDTKLEAKIADVRQELGEGFKAVNGRIDALAKSASDDTKALDRSLRADIMALDKRTTSHFLWLLSTMIACLLALVGALLKGLIAH